MTMKGYVVAIVVVVVRVQNGVIVDEVMEVVVLVVVDGVVLGNRNLLMLKNCYDHRYYVRNVSYVLVYHGIKMQI